VRFGNGCAMLLLYLDMRLKWFGGVKLKRQCK
jgi:hypothetical protein